MIAKKGVKMRKQPLLVALSMLLCLTFHASAQAQITASDLLFARLSTTTVRTAYEQRGGDPKEIAPLLEEASKSAATDALFIINELNKRLAEVEKLIGLLPDNRSPAALTAQYYLDAVRQAHQTYLGGSYQNLTGMLHTQYRSGNYGLSELMDFDAALDEAAKLATTLKEGRNPLAEARGDLKLVYRSSFDGKLVPYRLYIPTTYDKSKSYPMITLLHGAGGDENSFFNGYRGLWPKEAEARGYIIVAVNGRGPIGGYGKANGGEQDVLDVTALVQQNYNIDPQRVYLAGHSMGAGGTWSVGLAYRERFAALAPMAGTRPSAALEAALKTGRKLPIIVVAGGKDPLAPVAGCREVAAQAKALGYEVKYLEYPEGDHSSPVSSAVKDVFDWFEAHRRPAAKE